jgi:hypothetical protein
MSAVFNCEDMLEHLSSYLFLFGLGAFAEPRRTRLGPGAPAVSTLSIYHKEISLGSISLLEKTYLAVALALSFCDI